MESSEYREPRQVPEFDRHRPAELFEYARAKEQYLRDVIKPRIHDRLWPEHVAQLAEELEGHMTEAFETMPELEIITSDVYSTMRVARDKTGGHYIIESGPMPIDGEEDIVHNLTLQGRLFGFHKGDNDDLRMYVATSDGTHQLMGGIYIPLLSVSVEHSAIQPVEYTARERLVERIQYIRDCMTKGEEQGLNITFLVNRLMDILDNDNEQTASKLRDSSFVMSETMQRPGVSTHLVEALLEVISLKLGLYVPHEIRTSAHRIPVNNTGYIEQGVASFSGVTPTVGLLGESNRPSLGLFFLNGETAISIPAQYVTALYKSSWK